VIYSALARNATLLVGALLSEVKEGRKRDVIDSLLSSIQELGLSSDKDAQKLVTAGVLPTLILLLKTRAINGIGLETVLVTLGILTYVHQRFDSKLYIPLTIAALDMTPSPRTQYTAPAAPRL
jgi:hypothetical protein